MSSDNDSSENDLRLARQNSKPKTAKKWYKHNKVVRSIKNNEIPSTPKLKLKFKKGIHNNLLTN